MVRGYGYGDTGKRHFLKIDLRGYAKYMHKYIIKKLEPITNVIEDEKIDVNEIT